MDKVGEIIKANQQQSSGTSITPYDSRKHLVPQWAKKLSQMSQDMRQDLAPGQLDYWKIELRDYEDEEICDALALYRGEFFPNVKQIREIIDRKRQVKSQEHGLREWERWKQEQREAALEGKLATADEIREMVAGCRKAWEKLVANHNKVEDRGGLDKANIMGMEESATSSGGSSHSIQRQIECVSNKPTENLGRPEGTKA